MDAHAIDTRGQPRRFTPRAADLRDARCVSKQEGGPWARRTLRRLAKGGVPEATHPASHCDEWGPGSDAPCVTGTYDDQVSDECLFCRIVAGEIPADVVRRTDRAVAFRDLNPQAPTHVLVIPVEHQPDAGALATASPQTLAHLVEVAAQVAHEEGLGDGYRLVTNTGAAAGQTVFHVHVHLLGGRALTWPPG